MATDVMLMGDPTTAELIVVLVPGNPGNASFYEEYLEHLHGEFVTWDCLSFAVYALSRNHWTCKPAWLCLLAFPRGVSFLHCSAMDRLHVLHWDCTVYGVPQYPPCFVTESKLKANLQSRFLRMSASKSLCCKQTQLTFTMYQKRGVLSLRMHRICTFPGIYHLFSTYITRVKKLYILFLVQCKIVFLSLVDRTHRKNCRFFTYGWRIFHDLAFGFRSSENRTLETQSK